MVEDIDLEAIQKKIIKTAHQHGFFDMVIGFVYTGMAFGPIFRESLPEPYRYFLWPLILLCIGYTVVFIVTKYVIRPRMGFAKPGPKLKSVRKKIISITLIQVIFTLTIFLLPIIGITSGVKIEGILFVLIIGLVFIIPPFTIIAYLLKYPRLYAIGVLIWMGIFINETLNRSIDYRIRWLFSFGITGTIILSMGIIIFVRFLKNYPLPKKEDISNG